ncbi:MAG: hypothetical protein KAI84_18565 [Gammaproteobacteria bacterium]|nr:hypothetical protein [Gammaproteobacteria bacterium]
MQSSFGTSRIFHDQTGWYVVMRESDQEYLTGLKHKLVGNQHLMGPFLNKHRVKDWLTNYLAMHAENRALNAYSGTHH